MNFLSFIVIILISKVHGVTIINDTLLREEVVCGATVSDTAVGGEVYYHPFEITDVNGQFVTISSCESAARYDTMLTLFDSDGDTIGWNDDNKLCEVNPGTFKSILVSGLLQSGEYVVSITGWNRTSGYYNLHMECFDQGDDLNSDQDENCNFVNYNGAFNPLNDTFDTTLFEMDTCYTAGYNYYFRIESSSVINYDAISWKLECNGELNGWTEYIYEGDACTAANLAGEREVGPHFFEYNCKGNDNGCDVVTYTCGGETSQLIAGVCSDGVTAQCEPADDEYVKVYADDDCSSSSYEVWPTTDCWDDWQCAEGTADIGCRQGATIIFVFLSVILSMV